MKINNLVIVILVTVVIAGCSGAINPVTSVKDIHDDLSAVKNSPIPVGVSDRFSDGSPSAGEGVLGLYSLQLSSNPVEAELTPLRESALTDVLEVVDITNFLSLAPCTDCVKIRGISLNSDDHLVVSIGIKHPFPAGDMYKPISGKNRADLHVFNVEGIVISDAPGATYPGISATIAGFNLVNADGYTGYLDASLDSIFPTEATIHPYIMHFDDYSQGNFDPSNLMGFESVTEPPPSGNLVMAMGSDYNYQDYELDLNGSSMNFIFAVGCTYAVSAATKVLRFTPEYRIPQHNKKAASEVRVNIISSDLTDGDAVSSAVLNVAVLDINHGVPVGSGLGDMQADSSVASISVEVPGVTTIPVEIVSPTPSGGDGRDPLNPLTFEITITNNALGVAGTYPGLVKILDSYSPGQNTSPLLNGNDGISRSDPISNPLSSLFDINEFATYAVFTVDVAPGFISEPPVAVISEPCPDSTVKVDSYLFFDGRFSTDDFPPIAGYAWDFDWDGVEANFTPDSTLDHLNWQFTSTGTFTVGLRVEDAEAQFGYSSVTVIVEPAGTPAWSVPVAVASWDGVESVERDYGPSHQVVADCDGIVHMIFKFRNGSGPAPGVYYVNYDGSTMSTPELIDSGAGALCQPTLRLDNQGDLHFSYQANSEIRYCKRVDGIWSTPEAIVTNTDIPGYGIEFPSMAVNYLGEVRVVFAKTDGSYIWYLTDVHNDGSGWTDPVDITEIYLRTSSGSSLIPNEDLNVDPDGRFHLLYKSFPTSTSYYDTDFWHVICENGTWGTVNRFCNDPGYNIALGGYVAPDGDVFAVWQTSMYGTFSAMYQRYDASTQTWGASVRVSQDPLSGDYSWVPDIAVDAGGNVVYVWEYYDAIPGNSLRHVYSKTFHETDSASDIQNAAETELITGNWNKANSSVFFEPNGRVHVVFEDDRSIPNNYSARDMYYAVWE